MPRFYFNVFDGRSTRDTDGVNLPDCETARCEAIRLAGALLDEESPRLKDGDDWRLEVTDKTGLILIRLDFSVTVSAGAPLCMSTNKALLAR